MDDNLYWLMLMWSICETLYLYVYSKLFLVGVHVRTHMNIRLAHVLVDWLCFTSQGHGDVKLIMWAYVRHETELIQHEMMTSHYTICTLCPKTWDRRMYLRCEPTYLGAIKCYTVTGSYKGGFRVCQEACCETWSVKMGFAPLCKREISLGPSSDSDQEMHGIAGVKS